jgi:hypothetical protein
MALYLISYDIAEKDKAEYGPLWAHLEEIGAVKILFSEWVVVADVGHAHSLYADIAPLVRIPDRLLIQEILKDAAWDKLLISDADFNTLLRSARG